jgi:hypothetical protein
MAINVVHYMLTEYKRRYPKFPRVLRIQLDNTCKDNKNYALIAYLATLVYFDMIEVIEIHFLLKGHTHNDVDGVFGK